MIEQIEDAFNRKDYTKAAQLVQNLLKRIPEDPRVQLYVGQLHEVSHEIEEAEKIYRRLLQETISSKVLIQARQGIERLKKIKHDQKQAAINAAISSPINSEPGILVLEAVNSELKAIAAQKLAQVMEIDGYSAKLILPSRGWRLYRLGKVGELKFYGLQLQEADIPCFWMRISKIQQVEVFQVKYFLESTTKATVVCQNATNQMGKITFNWKEVKARVMGMLPIFEQVVDVNARHQLEWKTKTQDYAQFCDLLLPERNCILRLCDRGYEFQPGLKITGLANQNTTRINWNGLISWVEQQIPQVQVWSDFDYFAQTVLDQTEALSQITSHIQILRREKTNWDAAFQLYTSIVLIRNLLDKN
jgi:hypothetical protein